MSLITSNVAYHLKEVEPFHFSKPISKYHTHWYHVIFKPRMNVTYTDLQNHIIFTVHE